ncbi:uncharacterized protein LOC142238595 [Haematobia irritans]|uniref:uncharacterized protein LOC142238595 n=1 Tax=Haematobia irritans TaxID=7368 RepID=UPI003F4FD8B7
MTTKDTLKSDVAVTKTQVQHMHQLKHQHSFEQRYASIINQQILETTINKEVLQRQANAFFPFGRSSSNDSTEGRKIKKIPEEDVEEEEVFEATENTERQEEVEPSTGQEEQ